MSVPESQDVMNQEELDSSWHKFISDDDDDDEFVSPDENNFALSPIVTLIVGPDKIKYSAHKDLLVQKAPFFARCLASGMKENAENKINLPEDTSADIALLINWVYFSTVREPTSVEENKLVMHAWITADKFCMPTFQNALIDATRRCWTTNFITPAEFAWVLDHLGRDTMLYYLARDTLAWRMAQAYESYDPCSLECPDWGLQLDEIFRRADFSVHELIFRWLEFPWMSNEEQGPINWENSYHVEEV